MASSRVSPEALPSFLSTAQALYQPMLMEPSFMVSEMGMKAAGL